MSRIACRSACARSSPTSSTAASRTGTAGWFSWPRAGSVDEGRDGVRDRGEVLAPEVVVAVEPAHIDGGREAVIRNLVGAAERVVRALTDQGSGCHGHQMR